MLEWKLFSEYAQIANCSWLMVSNIVCSYFFPGTGAPFSGMPQASLQVSEIKPQCVPAVFLPKTWTRGRDGYRGHRCVAFFCRCHDASTLATTQCCDLANKNVFVSGGQKGPIGFSVAKFQNCGEAIEYWTCVVFQCMNHEDQMAQNRFESSKNFFPGRSSTMRLVTPADSTVGIAAPTGFLLRTSSVRNQPTRWIRQIWDTSMFPACSGASNRCRLQAAGPDKFSLKIRKSPFIWRLPKMGVPLNHTF